MAKRRNETQSKSIHHGTEVAHLTSNEASHNHVREDATQPPLTHSARLWAKVGICLAFQLRRLTTSIAPSLGPLLPLTPFSQLPNKPHGNGGQGLE